MGYARKMIKFGLFQHSWSSNSEFDSTIRPTFELVYDFIPVYVTWTFRSVLIKLNTCLEPGQTLGIFQQDKIPDNK